MSFAAHEAPWKLLRTCYYEQADSMYERMMRILQRYPALQESPDKLIWLCTAPPNAHKVCCITVCAYGLTFKVYGTHDQNS
jgi:hypothetical protein